jgi:predicted transcriptional regulator
MITRNQLRAARALIGWEQRDLADKAGVHLQTIRRLEGLKGSLEARESTIAAIQGAFERAGLEFTNGERPGVRLGMRASK